MFFQKDEERIRRRAQRTTSTEPAPGAQRPLPVLRQGPRCRNARPRTEHRWRFSSAVQCCSSPGNPVVRPTSRAVHRCCSRTGPRTVLCRPDARPRSSRRARTCRRGPPRWARRKRCSRIHQPRLPDLCGRGTGCRCARQRPGRTRSAARAPPGGGSASDRRTRARSSPSSGFPVMTRPSTRCWRTTPRRPTGRVPRCGPDRCRRSGPVPAARVALGRLVHVDVGAWHHVPVAVRGAVPPAAEERGVAPPRARCPPDCPSGSSRGRRGSPRRTPGCHRRWRARTGTRRTAPAPVVGPLGRNPGPQWSWSDRGRARSDVVPRTCFSRTRRSTRPQGGAARRSAREGVGSPTAPGGRCSALTGRALPAAADARTCGTGSPRWRSSPGSHQCEAAPVCRDRGCFAGLRSWWPGAGSNRRPSAFQADARTN